jgi:DNA-binding NarL/FixJ family response regulator
MDSCETVAPAVKAGVLIVDDHPVVRQGLSLVIDAEPDLAVCAEAADSAEALAAAGSTHPQVAVIDLSLRDGDAAPLIKSLRTKYPSLRVVVLSMHNERLHAERVLRAGAQAYVMKQEGTEHVIDAIRTVLRGGTWVGASARAALLLRAADPTRRTSPDGRLDLDLLTDREFEVFSLMGRGLTPAELAARLGVSAKTIDTFRERIKSKLGLPSAHALLVQAIEYVLGESNRPPPPPSLPPHPLRRRRRP